MTSELVRLTAIATLCAHLLCGRMAYAQVAESQARETPTGAAREGDANAQRTETLRSGAGEQATLAPPTPAWTIQVDPLTTLLGITHVLLERRALDSLSFYVGPSLRLFDSPLTKDAEEGYRAYGVEMGARWFFLGGAPAGWWAGVRGVLAQMRYAGQTEAGGYVSVLAGGTWIIQRRWVLAAALGVSYFAYDIGGVGLRGFRPGAHTALGVAF